LDTLRRWDLVLVDFGAGADREQSGARLALVVSNDGFNRHFPLATVLPLTKRDGKRRQAYSFEVVLPAGSVGNQVESVVMPHQVRPVSRSRVIRHVGRLNDPALRASVEQRLADHLALGRALTQDEA
jgi:mRNA-degrading endonuclease toxin of MazEF toxin-antitoxin module